MQTVSLHFSTNHYYFAKHTFSIACAIYPKVTHTEGGGAGSPAEKRGVDLVPDSQEAPPPQTGGGDVGAEASLMDQDWHPPAYCPSSVHHLAFCREKKEWPKKMSALILVRLFLLWKF